MGVKGRILEYLDFKGVKITRAEQDLGWSKSSLLKSNNVSGDKIGEFVLFYSDISPEWLLTGSGEMLKKPTVQDASIPSGRIGVERSFLEKEAFYLKLIGERTDDLIKAEEIIEDLKEEIEHLKKQIKISDRDSKKISVDAVKHKLS